MTTPFLFELAAALLASVAGAIVAERFSRKANRSAQAEERIAAALERVIPAPPAQVLPRPSLLHHADLKPIPSPDPEPCGDAVACREDFERELNHTEDRAWARLIKRLPGRAPYFSRLPTLGGTAVER